MKLIKQYSVSVESEMEETVVDNKEISRLNDEKHYVSLLSNNLCKLAISLEKDKAELVDSAVDWLEDIVSQKQSYQLDYDRLCRLGIDQQNLNEITIKILNNQLSVCKDNKTKKEISLLIADLKELQEYYKQQIPQPDFYLKNTPNK